MEPARAPEDQVYRPIMPMQERRMQIASGHFREEAFKKNKDDQKDQEA